MLPFCERITLYEWSRGNIKWLKKQLRRHGPAWEQYWHRLAESDVYAQVEDPWSGLQLKARITRGSVFDMTERELDMGTMFFVAESISKWVHEFESAVGGFLGALRLGARSPPHSCRILTVTPSARSAFRRFRFRWPRFAGASGSGRRSITCTRSARATSLYGMAMMG